MHRVLIVNCFETYEHRVELLRSYFQKNGCSVKVITSDWLHMHKTVRKSCPEGYEMLHVKPYTKNLSPQRLMSHDGFAKEALKKMEQYQPQLLWVLVPPNSLAETAAQYKKKHPQVKLVMDFIDMWPETMPISKFKNLPPFSNWKMLRDKNVNTADLVVTECRLYQEVLRNVVPEEKMHTLYLARKPAREQSDSVPVLPEDRVGLCYLGSINNIIDIPCIAQIISSIEAPVDLHIIGDGEKRQELLDAAAQAGANVIFHGKIYDPEEKQAIFDRCHFGLNIMKDSVFVGLTMKSIDYFEGGLPIINTIQADTWDFVEKEGLGINYRPGQALSADVLAKGQERRPLIRAFCRQYFSVETFENTVKNIMEHR